MLMSDGIAEGPPNSTGSLFGFDRIRDLLRNAITAPK